jgi:Xaa-Pro aminopeptidase
MDFSYEKRKELIQKIRDFLKSGKLDLLIINSTDEYLNEYVDLENNSRFMLTGFTGSMGDVIITPDEIFLFVDGRYHLQAERETESGLITVVKVGLSLSPREILFEKAAELISDEGRVGIISSKTSFINFKELLEVLKSKNNAVIVEYEQDPVIKFAEIETKSHSQISLRHIPIEITGKSFSEKIDSITELNKNKGIDLLVVTKTDEIAYITNLRGNEIPFSSCFKAKALIAEGKVYIFLNKNKLPEGKISEFSENIIFHNENEFFSVMQNFSKKSTLFKVGCDPNYITISDIRKIEKTGLKTKELDINSISLLKSEKTFSEIKHIKECFLKTDIVMKRAIAWVNQSLEKNEKISEKSISDRIKTLFTEEGALELSFKPITSSGENTAFIHYTTPNPEKLIQTGDLVLIDCGGYFEGGYATDITRTFLAGGKKALADNIQKSVYTTVLKGFLAGLYYELSEETTGFEIDKAVRELIEANKPEGFSFLHSTGHGIGIAVHESPPRIGPNEQSKTVLKPNMCFTIEPGLYCENIGGVRLENTVMIQKINVLNQIRTLTKCGFDENLIDYSLLTEKEKEWLKNYNKFRTC